MRVARASATGSTNSAIVFYALPTQFIGMVLILMFARYLPAAGIPIARGWFRQDDFPRNGVLYSNLDRDGYLTWLHALGVRRGDHVGVLMGNRPEAVASLFGGALVGAITTPLSISTSTTSSGVIAS